MRGSIPAVSRRVGFVLIVGALLSGCSASVTGTGTVAADAIASTTPAPTTSATPAPTTPAPPPDPAKVAAAVNLRQDDFPAGWKPVPGSGTEGDDSANWTFACARDASVPPGTQYGAQTPDISPDGTHRTSQVGSVSGVFPDEAAAEKFVALFRRSEYGSCLGAEAMRAWPGTFRTVPPFVPLTFLRAGLSDTSAMAAVATTTQGRKMTIQFLVMRSGPVVAMVSTYWVGSPDNPVVDRVSSRVALRLGDF